MRCDVFAMVFMDLCLCVSVLVSCTSLKTPSKPSTVTSVCLQTGKRENQDTKETHSTVCGFQHLRYSPSLSVAVGSLHLFQSDGQERFI